jgi:pyrimidine operon attenuation protein/uracil phosphoribosyltransferase
VTDSQAEAGATASAPDLGAHVQHGQGAAPALRRTHASKDAHVRGSRCEAGSTAAHAAHEAQPPRSAPASTSHAAAGPDAGGEAGGPVAGAGDGAPADGGPVPRIVLDAPGVSRAVQRIAHEILERNRDIDQVALVAIVRGGIPVGRMLADRLQDLCGRPVLLGELDVTLYRDDVIGRGKRPVPRRTQMPQSVLGKRVVLIDDVVFTGRTIRAAMDAVIDFGRPQAIQVACLIDRGHRELPIQVAYVGKNIPTRREEEVSVLAVGDGYEVHVA